MTGPDRTPGQGGMRVVRALLFAGAAVAFSTTAHVMGGGTAPSGLVLVALALILGLLGTPLAGRRRGPVALGAAMVAVQSGLHHLFGLLSGPVGCTPALATQHHHLGHATASAPGCEALTGPATAALTGPAMTGLSGTMLLAHALAAVALGLLLARGERALWFLLDQVSPRLPGVPARGPVPVCGGLPAPVEATWYPRPRLLVGGLGRRGPPRVPRVPAQTPRELVT